MFVFVHFMQLYELDSDPNRKEFLDDLFTFMQKRGEATHFLILKILTSAVLCVLTCVVISPESAH